MNATAGSVSATSGVLIVNADDWGFEPDTTTKILDCALRGAVSSVSAMVWMKDSERAAAIARERGIEAGLHLNMTTRFSAQGCRPQLLEAQEKVASYLRRHRFAQVIFNPALAPRFEYLVAAQIDEFRRLYGSDPERIDGHHHMHLSANVVLGRLLPHGTLVRRNFAFEPQEKGLLNRLYRQSLDRFLSRRHRLVDFLFSLAPIGPPGRVQRIFSIARRFVVELETHPVETEEYHFLHGGEFFRQTQGLRLASFSILSAAGRGAV